jgi:hypothetical protein
MKKYTLTSIMGTVLALSSCSHVTVTKTGSGIFSPTTPANVEIRATVPERKFDEVAMVSVDAFGNPANAYNLIRQKSSALGADAVILQNQMPFPPRVLINGVAIKYKK